MLTSVAHISLLVLSPSKSTYVNRLTFSLSYLAGLGPVALLVSLKQNLYSLHAFSDFQDDFFSVMFLTINSAVLYGINPLKQAVLFCLCKMFIVFS